MIHGRDDYNGRIVDKEGKIPQDEPVFFLRAQDMAAASTVRYWATLNEKHGGDASLSAAAREHAKKMDDWPVKKPADG